MSRVEKYDPSSGAILFKKDKDGRDLESALKRIADLEKKVSKLEASIKKLNK